MAKLTKRPDGRYSMQIFLGRDKNGKRKYKTVYGATQKEVQQKADEVRVKLGKGIDVDAEKDTFSQWRDRWLQQKQLTVSDKTHQTLRTCTEPMNAELGLTELPKIIPAQIQDVISDMYRKGYAKSTLTKAIQYTSQIFKLAIINRVTDFDPTIAVSIPQGAPTVHRTALSEEQQRWIRETPHRAQTAAMIMLYAGLRRGELIPLQWSDIDLDERTIDINKSVTFPHGKPIIKIGAKTDAGTRIVSIPDILVEYLSSQPDQNGLVVPSAKGNLMSSEAWQEMWHTYMLDLNIKYGYNGEVSKFSHGIRTKIETFTAHQLRHTYASLLYLAGVDVMTAKEQLGHADVKTTLGIYTHLDAKYKRRALNKLNDYLNPDNSGQGHG